MPTNLNALIRYKTINSCLYGGTRRYSIKELIERCSDALYECRGRDENLSERTIREDLRVMRSDILGFNAPIRQQDGLYYYDDPYYSILSVNFPDSELIEKVIGVLQKIRSEIKNQELDLLLEKLTHISGKTHRVWRSEETYNAESPLGFRTIKPENQPVMPRHVRKEDKGKMTENALKQIKEESGFKRLLSVKGKIIWGDIMKFI